MIQHASAQKFTFTLCHQTFFFSIDASSSLDDSLTNIQWLCNLDSHPLLETDPRPNAPTGSMPMNPYPKPPFSYATLILFAINSTFEKRMTLQDIYKWIEDNFPYYKHCKKAWKVRILKKKMCLCDEVICNR